MTVYRPPWVPHGLSRGHSARVGAVSRAAQKRGHLGPTPLKPGGGGEAHLNRPWISCFIFVCLRNYNLANVSNLNHGYNFPYRRLHSKQEKWNRKQLVLFLP